MREGGRLIEECNGLGSEVVIYRWEVINVWITNSLLVFHIKKWMNYWQVATNIIIFWYCFYILSMVFYSGLSYGYWFERWLLEH